jgi:hypothetical protein
MPAPLKFDKPMTRRNLFIDDKVYNALKKIAHRERRPVAEIIREASLDYVRTYAAKIKARAK